LGHIISDDRNDETDIIARGNSLYQINNVISYFRNHTSLVKLLLMRAYCSSFYGCELWELDHTKLKLICTTWRKGLRRIWDLPYDTHNEAKSGTCAPIAGGVYNNFSPVFTGAVLSPVMFTTSLTGRHRCNGSHWLVPRDGPSSGRAPRCGGLHAGAIRRPADTGVTGAPVICGL
jgi:hypothetical protein